MELNTSGYSLVTINAFKGLYKRGMADECPIDHLICCQNMQFNKKGETTTRPGSALSLAVGHPIVRMCLATFNDNTITFVSCDGVGHLYQGAGTLLFTSANMVDFAFLNMFNKFFVLPLANSFPPANLQVWDGVNPMRDAAGLAPTVTFTAADGAADPTGGLDIGVHLFAVSYITNTGFTTQPGPKIAGVFAAVSYTAPGQKKVHLSGIPTGPSYVTGRQILVTKANEKKFFFAPLGVINDNVTTTLDLDFFDTDLVISADYLFDLLETIPGGIVAGGLTKYHGSLVLVNGDLVRVSRPGEPEAMNNVNGFVQMPAEKDGNIGRSAIVLRDTLYLNKAVGIFSTQDNGSGDPSSWPIIQIDGGVGAYQNSISSITGSQPALGMSEIFLICNREGVFIFDGTVVRPPLTWKIDDIWKTLTHGVEYNINLCIDVFNEMVYIILPTHNSFVPNLMLMMDYSEGLNWSDVKWSLYFFPFPVSSISLMNFLDVDGFPDYDYYLRLGSSNGNLYKHHPGYTDDVGTAIDSFIQSFLASHSQGGLNLLREVRLRVKGPGTLTQSISPEDLQSSVSLPSIVLGATPGQDFLTQANFMNEKYSITLGTNAIADRFTVQRIDLYGKSRFMARPG